MPTIAPDLAMDSLLQVAIPTPSIFNNYVCLSDPVVIPSGSLRIGGDSPNGLVLVGDAPASRIVDCFTRDMLSDPPVLVHVARTISSGSGTYAFLNLSARAQGYDCIIRGDIGSGERDVIISGVHPG